ncbi:MAG: sigma-70 family RNA polymerase sigma factor [Lachnospiraceae bacterium]|nr:sigma-70 family RNA polymerase sigma factor [Lachnospiraceae bacterium]
MNYQANAEQIITQYLKPIYGFALKKCKNLQDAEDLSQEIACKAFRALLVKDDIEDVSKFIWTIAHNALSNYYRANAKSIVGVSIDEVAELIADPTSPFDEDDSAEAIKTLQSEIAYLSKLQRQIVIAYYFENRKQEDIATQFGIPLGTVKWHLFEAKKELKRGMNTMRKTSELKFNPIKFTSYGVNGSNGDMSPDDYFRTPLSQNICYCVRDTAMTINEIADALGVSPVYVEGEVEFLEKNGFLKMQKDKYIANFIISSASTEFLSISDQMYKKATELFANDLYDELCASGILDDASILCAQTDDETLTNISAHPDHNYLLWSLVPFVATWSGKDLIDRKITFEEVATIRPDGANNIFKAQVAPENLVLPEDFVPMNNWCGPMWIGCGGNILWQIDCEYSYRGKDQHGMLRYDDVSRLLSLYQHEMNGERLSKDDYAWLAQRGYIKTNGDYDGMFKAAWQVIILKDKEIKQRLVAIGDKLKEKYKAQFDDLKIPYAKALLAATPKHLQKITEYELQYTFHSDGWFLLHCINTLVQNGKLKQPTEGQRKSLMTLIFQE